MCLNKTRVETLKKKKKKKKNPGFEGEIARALHRPSAIQLIKFRTFRAPEQSQHEYKPSTLAQRSGSRARVFQLAAADIVARKPSLKVTRVSAGCLTAPPAPTIASTHTSANRAACMEPEVARGGRWTLPINAAALTLDDPDEPLSLSLSLALLLSLSTPRTTTTRKESAVDGEGGKQERDGTKRETFRVNTCMHMRLRGDARVHRAAHCYIHGSRCVCRTIRNQEGG